MNNNDEKDVVSTQVTQKPKTKPKKKPAAKYQDNINLDFALTIKSEEIQDEIVNDSNAELTQSMMESEDAAILAQLEEKFKKTKISKVIKPLTLSDNVRKIASLQVTQLSRDFDFYEKLSEVEFAGYNEFVKERSKILDLGCGVGRSAAYLNMRLDHEPHFIMADFDEVADIRYGWDSDSIYNSLEATKEFCEDNGMTNFELFDLGRKSVSELKDVDMVMSFLAVGFHVKIDAYLSDLLAVTTKDALFVFGVREGQYTEKDFEEYFEHVEIRKLDSSITKQDILIMFGKK